MTKFLILSIVCASQVDAFDSFEIESEKVSASVGCEEPKTRYATTRWSGLFTCVGGSAQNVEISVNEQYGSGKVSNVILVWADWRQDTGYGVRPSRETARDWVTLIATMYAPQNSDPIIAAFSSNKDFEIETEEYVLEYTYRIGPSIDERKLVITENPVRAQDSQSNESMNPPSESGFRVVTSPGSGQ